MSRLFALLGCIAALSCAQKQEVARLETEAKGTRTEFRTRFEKLLVWEANGGNDVIVRGEVPAIIAYARAHRDRQAEMVALIEEYSTSQCMSEHDYVASYALEAVMDLDVAQGLKVSLELLSADATGCALRGGAAMSTAVNSEGDRLEELLVALEKHPSEYAFLAQAIRQATRESGDPRVARAVAALDRFQKTASLSPIEQRNIVAEMRALEQHLTLRARTNAGNFANGSASTQDGGSRDVGEAAQSKPTKSGP